ncbi:hypothetical protein LWI28_003270 [Acer negundo]|uniref:Uncharacterized protein n=1 Tax=Acer negundo TaxID=4023 RepID=A0AAD5J311_ACENE|nr:hypothetical protein LWI28_003270 [Acer negundo]
MSFWGFSNSEWEWRWRGRVGLVDFKDRFFWLRLAAGKMLKLLDVSIVWDLGRANSRLRLSCNKLHQISFPWLFKSDGSHVLRHIGNVGPGSVFGWDSLLCLVEKKKSWKNLFASMGPGFLVSIALIHRSWKFDWNGLCIEYALPNSISDRCSSIWVQYIGSSSTAAIEDVSPILTKFDYPKKGEDPGLQRIWILLCASASESDRAEDIVEERCQDCRRLLQQRVVQSEVYQKNKQRD